MRTISTLLIVTFSAGIARAQSPGQTVETSARYEALRAKIKARIAELRGEPLRPPSQVTLPEIDLTTVENDSFDFTADELGTLASQLNESCPACSEQFSYVFLALSCHKPPKCQLQLAAKDLRSHAGYLATLAVSPSAKSREALNVAIAQAIGQFERAPTSGRPLPNATREVQPRTGVAEPLIVSKEERPLASAKPQREQAAPAPSPAMRANKNLAD